MSAHRILLVENPAELSIVDGRLRLRREAMDDVFVLPDDIAVLVLHHPMIRMSAHVLRALAQAGGMLLVTDERHYPAGMLWPWTGHSVFTRRLRQQIALDAGEKKTALWGQLVRGRIATQALNLRHFSCNGALRLERLCGKVKPGDPDNLEAQATRHYWRYFLRKESAGKSKARSNRSTRDSTSASPYCARWWRGKSPRPVSTRPWAWATTTWKIRLISPMI